MTSFQRRRVIAMGLLPLIPGLALACGAQTEAQTPGPFFKPSSPERRDLRENSAAPALVLSGLVLGADCKPVAHALLDFWHADERGDYDNEGFRYRGHQFTDAQGRWRLDTIVPAVYPGRTRHIHVKVQRPGGRVLTTQLYFPGEPGNARDGLFSRALVLKDNKFDFVV
ncbi:MAG TPA: intradiol ring-cleavage dioxygenase [Burkholderiales bacterium]|jgi:protocatechuate 3,4-dioxygenase beta subunit|nr:intradiol ring-cleavage dioxygenase [Burkholderiales bacterium]